METRRRIGPTAMLATGLMALWVTMLLGGAGPADNFLLGELYAAHRPALRTASSFVTVIGNWHVMLPVSVAVGLWLAFRGHRRSAVLFLGITLVGRLLIELQKLRVNRLRPGDLEHLVEVKSLSFPSAHAANSMILFLSIATIAVPREHRRWAVIAALAGTFLVGISRPMLGVHYPSDVVGGWTFGAAWVLLMLALAERWPSRKTVRR